MEGRGDGRQGGWKAGGMEGRGDGRLGGRKAGGREGEGEGRQGGWMGGGQDGSRVTGMERGSPGRLEDKGMNGQAEARKRAGKERGAGERRTEEWGLRKR